MSEGVSDSAKLGPSAVSRFNCASASEVPSPVHGASGEDVADSLADEGPS